MLARTEGESEGHRVPVVSSGVLTWYLRVHRFDRQLFSNSSIFFILVCVLSDYSAIHLLDAR